MEDLVKSTLSQQEVYFICCSFNNDPVTKITTLRPDGSHMVFRNTATVADSMMVAPPTVTGLHVWKAGSYNCGMHEYYSHASSNMRWHSDSAIDLVGTIAIIALTDGITLEVQPKNGDVTGTGVVMACGDVYQFTLDFNARMRHRLTFSRPGCRLLTLYQSRRTNTELHFRDDNESVNMFRNYRHRENNEMLSERDHVQDHVQEVQDHVQEVQDNVQDHERIDFTISQNDLSYRYPPFGIYQNVFDRDILEKLQQDHQMQPLLLGRIVADRTGCYISNVSHTVDGDTFSLLRCSTQFKQGTHQMMDSDKEIFSRVNDLVRQTYGTAYPELNHALLQCYHNHSSIGTHSDKTRDMPERFIIAFVTFYKDIPLPEERAKIRFYKKSLGRAKPESATEAHSKARWELDPNCDLEIVLDHGSVILTTDYVNTNYCHTIIETSGNAERTSYTMRTSCVSAIARPDGIVTLLDGRPLLEATYDDRKALKKLYVDENVETTRVVYPAELEPFTVNIGDLLAPVCQSVPVVQEK